MTSSLARRDGRPAAPVRHVHLGLGNFFRAHQAFYTEHAPDAADWGIAAFTGRRPELAEALTEQGDVYTLVTRSGDGDRRELISSLSACHPGADLGSWLGYLASAQTRLLTLTVTEAGYRDGPATERDLAALKAGGDGPLSTVAGRLVAGLAARRAADAGPIAIVPCDNLTDNGAVAARAVADFARRLDPTLAAWIGESVSFLSTVVDRITPRLEPAEITRLNAGAARVDSSPVVTEPFSEWILSGSFPLGRPDWSSAGARFTDDLGPFENRKLWLLNGGHCLLAYAGSLRGHHTVAEAVADQQCLSWLADWWQEAGAQLSQSAAEVADYQRQLLARFGNSRIQHRLAQIAADGSQKLPIRVLPVVRAERAAGRIPLAGLRILAAWLCHLRGGGAPVTDPEAATLTALAAGELDHAAARLLGFLDEALAADPTVVAVVAELAGELTGAG